MLDIESINNANKLQSKFKPRIILKENRISDQSYYMNSRSNQQLRQLENNLYELLEHDFLLYDTDIQREDIRFSFYNHCFDIYETKQNIFEISHSSFVHNFTIELHLGLGFDINKLTQYVRESKELNCLSKQLTNFIMHVAKTKHFKYVCFNIPKRAYKSFIHGGSNDKH